MLFFFGHIPLRGHKRDKAAKLPLNYKYTLYCVLLQIHFVEHLNHYLLLLSINIHLKLRGMKCSDRVQCSCVFNIEGTKKG